VPSERPRCSGAADKNDEFPSPHGLAHAKDYIGYTKKYHIFGSRIVPFVTPKRCASMSAMGHNIAALPSHIRFTSKKRTLSHLFDQLVGKCE
jgi:hypothetical protein